MFSFTCQPQWDHRHIKQWSELVSIVLEYSDMAPCPSEACLVMPGLCSSPQLKQYHDIVYACENNTVSEGLPLLDFDPQALPFTAGSFDRIIVPFTLDFLHTQEEQQACLSEICRTLSPSGSIDLIQWRYMAGFYSFLPWHHAYALPKKRLRLRKAVLKTLLQPFRLCIQ